MLSPEAIKGELLKPKRVRDGESLNAGAGLEGAGETLAVFCRTRPCKETGLFAAEVHLFLQIKVCQS